MARKVSGSIFDQSSEWGRKKADDERRRRERREDVVVPRPVVSDEELGEKVTQALEKSEELARQTNKIREKLGSGGAENVPEEERRRLKEHRREIAKILFPGDTEECEKKFGIGSSKEGEGKGKKKGPSRHRGGWLPMK